ncbi:MAG: hypothetical protein ACKOTF_06840 [Opitutaceae bacterium]
MMALPWILLIVALALLAFPFPAFYSRRHSYRALAELDIERRNASWWKAWRRVLRFPWHWAEIVRGAAAAWFATTMLDHVAPGWAWYAENASWTRPVVPLVAAYVSVVLSAALFRSPGKQPAPVFFTGAVILVLMSPTVAVSAVLLAATGTLAFKSLPLFFIILGPVTLALGMVFDREPWPSAAGCLFALAPVLVAAGRHQEILLPVHRSRGRSTGESDSEHKL